MAYVATILILLLVALAVIPLAGSLNDRRCERCGVRGKRLERPGGYFATVCPRCDASWDLSSEQ